MASEEQREVARRHDVPPEAAVPELDQRSRRARADLPANPTVGDVLVAYLAEHLAALEREHSRLRAGEEEGVHQLRVAARRLRSALATYQPALEEGATTRLRDELRWLGRLLGDARDVQVARERLLSLVRAEPAELVLGPVAARIDNELRVAFRSARSRAEAELEGTRYTALLGRMESFIVDPPLSEAGHEPPAEQLPRLLGKDLRRVHRRHRAVQDAASPALREVALHGVRKAAKRLRYAAESAEPVFGERAEQLSRQGKAITSLLGDHQDTVVARRLLRDLGVRAHLAGENGFTFGRLHALEEAAASELRRRYPELYDELPTKQLRRWLAD